MATAHDIQLQQRLKDPVMRAKAFEEIVRLYQEKLYWQIRHMVTFHEDANDVLQTVFLKAWTGLDGYKGLSSISTWLFRIAANESVQWLRNQKQAVSLQTEDYNLEEVLRSDPNFDGDDCELLLQKAISMLPPKQKLVFVMRYYDEMKFKDMAEVLETSEGALKASFHLAQKKIQEFFASRS